jgi:hypothetical protein
MRIFKTVRTGVDFPKVKRDLKEYVTIRDNVLFIIANLGHINFVLEA